MFFSKIMLKNYDKKYLQQKSKVHSKILRKTLHKTLTDLQVLTLTKTIKGLYYTKK